MSGKDSKTAFAAKLSLAAIVIYHVQMTAMILIRPDLDPYWHTISEYAVGPYGWVMKSAFWVAAVSYVSLFVAIRPHISGVVGKTGLVILAVCSLGLLGVGYFVTDPLDTPPDAMTTRGIAHLIFRASQLRFLPISALLINLSLAFKNKNWTAGRPALFGTCGLPLLGLIGFMAHFAVFLAPLGENAYGPGVPIGWPPRLLFLTYAVWLITLALQSIKVNRKLD